MCVFVYVCVCVCVCKCAGVEVFLCRLQCPSVWMCLRTMCVDENVQVSRYCCVGCSVIPFGCAVNILDCFFYDGARVGDHSLVELHE